MNRTILAATLVIGPAMMSMAQGPRRGAPSPVPPAVPPRPLIANAEAVRSCESLRSVAVANTTIESAAVEPGIGASSEVCRVTATVTHPPAGDRVKVFIGLPVKNWNGRFQGTGGGGFSGGNPNGVRPPAALGYAAGATDTGHEAASGGFALDANGRLNWMLIRDNAYLGIHEMTVIGKVLTESFYGKAPRHSYFSGCSTGGRQALMEAQRYPQDYDGVVAGAPAINWTKLHVEQLWGQLVMKESDHFVPQCKFAAATVAAVSACDAIDGVRDGVIEDPKRCTFDPKALLDAPAGECGALTAADVDVIRKIWQGPRRRDGSFLWYGLAPGGDFGGVSATGGTPLAGRPMGITLDWWKYFLAQNPQFDWTTLTFPAYEQFWDQSNEEFGAVIGTDNPDLSGFRERGGKAIVWHGWADSLIYPE
ncbi:MAG: tannase/feruloyl esterase family alpha/beta hydrolase [Acidobacteriia bacterium]|nr:tannase/feruloyl esterase family alpha/beta hydrolase [Terriglobia bacterium]